MLGGSIPTGSPCNNYKEQYALRRQKNLSTMIRDSTIQQWSSQEAWISSSNAPISQWWAPNRRSGAIA
ncbi:hypothetical protein N7510_010659 [Penicillium lagena]|uniref:uncharacterized protein n=1 Tax=Penicillium lagena TaxID=94218 RepID=UPI002540D388|nr:uncharacterized protein N7510_010659 [Penicillium lagena]KAJ5601125.1 hypothetical protein N7510_010659 [Penicillium lagena]